MLQPIPKEGEGNAPHRPVQRPSLDERFIIKLKDKEYVTYAGLLDRAHQHGLVRLEVEPIQFPTADNGMECICRATAETQDGMVFTDIGDANPGNTNNVVTRHIIRMASTRAKARVLRDFTNIGMTALEELGDNADDIKIAENSSKKGKDTEQAGMGKTERIVLKSAHGESPIPITGAQKRAIRHLARIHGLDERNLNNRSEAVFGCGVDEMDSNCAAAMIVQLQQPVK